MGRLALAADLVCFEIQLGPDAIDPAEIVLLPAHLLECCEVTAQAWSLLHEWLLLTLTVLKVIDPLLRGTAAFSLA